MGRPLTAFQRLAAHAAQQGDDTALVVRHGESVVALTWAQLRQRVEAAAAGLLGSGLRRGRVALLMIADLAVALEVQHAVRSAGAVPVLVSPEVDGEELATALAGVRVGLVVTGPAGPTASLDGVDLSEAGALPLDADGHAWNSVLALGTAALAMKPSTVTMVDRDADREATRPLVLEPGLTGPRVGVLPRTTATDARTVLVTGRPSDAHVQQAFEDHLDTGATLILGGAGDLGALLAAGRPEVVVLDARTGGGFEDVLSAATVGGRPWTRDPRAVLDTLREVEGGRRVWMLARRRIASVETLGTWLGGRVRELRVVGGPTRLVANLGHVLEIETSERVAVELVEVVVPRRDQLRHPAQPLNQRVPQDRDEAFTLSVDPADGFGPAAAEDDVEPDDDDSTLSMGLIGGESVLDRVLAEQARAARAAEAAPAATQTTRAPEPGSGTGGAHRTRFLRTPELGHVR